MIREEDWNEKIKFRESDFEVLECIDKKTGKKEKSETIENVNAPMFFYKLYNIRCIISLFFIFIIVM